VPDDWKFGKRQEPNTLHYCVDARDPDFPVARKIGAAIASALLLQPKEHVIGEKLVTEDTRQSSTGLSRDLRHLSRLQAHSGRLSGLAHGVRGPYYPGLLCSGGDRSGLEVARRHAAIAGDQRHHRDRRRPSPDPVSAGLAGRSQRWSRFPMGTDEAALRSVLRGTAGAALVWAPAVWALQAREQEFSKLRLIAPTPLPASTADVGAGAPVNEPFMRSAVDQAIASLTADGTIEALLKGSKVPATAAK
jgi:polar amino acid transport system substrate-binding protein